MHLLRIITVVVISLLIVTSASSSTSRNFLSFLILRQTSGQDDVDSRQQLLTSLSSSKQSRQIITNCTSIVNDFTRTIARESTNVDDLMRLCSDAINIGCQPSSEDLLAFHARYFSNDSVAMDTFSDLCPVMLAKDALQLSSSLTCPVGSLQEKTSGKPSAILVWSLGILSVTIISLTSILGVIIIPFLNETSYMRMMNLFEGLAVGSLLASAIFHLIPQAFGFLSNPVLKHDYLWRAMMIFVGVYLFYWSERIMKMISAASERRDHKMDTNVSHQSPSSDGDNRAILNEINGQTAATTVDSHLAIEDPSNQPLTRGDRSQSLSERARKMSDAIVHHHHNHLPSLSKSPKGKRKIATVAWMIIFGDGLHNFIDGLSIGAAFSESLLTGLSISLACVCEEFPHELGDFAVLLASGMSVKEAVGYNFLSACTCFLGLIVGITFGDIGDGPTYIFALAGGMFLYISLVDMMSELTATVDAASKVSTKQTLDVLLLQNVGILSGVALLFLLAKYSEYISFSTWT